MLSVFRLLIAASAACSVSANATADDFYQGKQLKLIVGTAVGGSYDFAGRLISRHLSRHIPGAPSIVVQNMPGASGLNAANFIYGIAPQDGTTLGVVVQLVPQYFLFKYPGVRYDPGKFQWIGNFSSSANVYAVSNAVEIKNISEIFQKEILFGAANRAGSGGSEILLLNNLLGTKFKLVTGYKGGADIDLAMERGEIHGRAAQSWDGWKATKPDWIRDGKIKVILQVGLKRDSELPEVPLITELAQTDEQKAVLQLFSSFVALGRPLLVGPDVPSERVAILRKAFSSTVKDPEFINDANKNNFSVSPIHGEELQQLIGQMLSVPPEITKKAQAALKD